ncbi:hypothetical protein D3C72_951890 [compost metagenome]
MHRPVAPGGHQHLHARLSGRGGRLSGFFRVVGHDGHMRKQHLQPRREPGPAIARLAASGVRVHDDEPLGGVHRAAPVPASQASTWAAMADSTVSTGSDESIAVHGPVRSSRRVVSACTRAWKATNPSRPFMPLS